MDLFPQWETTILRHCIRWVCNVLDSSTQVMVCRGYGVLEVDSRRPVTSATPFPIASLTKAFLSTLLAQLIQSNPRLEMLLFSTRYRATLELYFCGSKLISMCGTSQYVSQRRIRVLRHFYTPVCKHAHKHTNTYARPYAYNTFRQTKIHTPTTRYGPPVIIILIIITFSHHIAVTTATNHVYHRPPTPPRTIITTTTTTTTT